jgi:hypothetical protein
MLEILPVIFFVHGNPMNAVLSNRLYRGRREDCDLMS